LELPEGPAGTLAGRASEGKRPASRRLRMRAGLPSFLIFRPILAISLSATRIGVVNGEGLAAAKAGALPSRDSTLRRPTRPRVELLRSIAIMRQSSRRRRARDAESR
jgi:hypothetical protein